MMKIEVVAHTDEDLELLKPLLDPERAMLQHPRHWETRVLFEELQRRAATVGKQVHLVEVSGEGHTATQVGEAPPHTHTDPGGSAETTRQAGQNPAPSTGNGAARNKGFTAEAKRLWEQYRKYHQFSMDEVEGTSRTQKVTKGDMERWIEAHPEVVRAFADDHAPPQTSDEHGGNAPTAPVTDAPAADEGPTSDTVIAWANVMMQHGGFDGLKQLFGDLESTSGTLKGVDPKRWPEMINMIQERTGIMELPT